MVFQSFEEASKSKQRASLVVGVKEAIEIAKSR
jgi:hypothetical protein